MPDQIDRRSRSWGRFLAPGALLLVVVAIVVVVSGALDTGGVVTVSHPGERGAGARHGAATRTTTRHAGSTGGSQAPAGTSTTSTTATGTTTGGDTYTVKPGDILGTIAAQTGVSVARLEQLNPGVSPTSLRIGEQLRLH